jgi:thiosulfate dehydrogenase [quinone] large subunit
MNGLTGFQQLTLILVRTLIGWHFFYEGYYKLVLPGWSADGRPVPAWSAAGYLKGATGPLADAFHRLAQPGVSHAIDLVIPWVLMIVGLMLMLGFFTQIACLGAAALLAVFYLSAPPLAGIPQAGTEGAYLLVNKNLIELAAIAVLFSFRTGSIAGLDRRRLVASTKRAAVTEQRVD